MGFLEIFLKNSIILLKNNCFTFGKGIYIQGARWVKRTNALIELYMGNISF